MNNFIPGAETAMALARKTAGRLIRIINRMLLNNFTPRVRKAMDLAREEAIGLHHGFVSTEHLLLGLVKLDQGVAVNVLKK